MMACTWLPRLPSHAGPPACFGRREVVWARLESVPQPGACAGLAARPPFLPLRRPFKALLLAAASAASLSPELERASYPRGVLRGFSLCTFCQYLCGVNRPLVSREGFPFSLSLRGVQELDCVTLMLQDPRRPCCIERRLR